MYLVILTYKYYWGRKKPIILGHTNSQFINSPASVLQILIKISYQKIDFCIRMTRTDWSCLKRKQDTLNDYWLSSYNSFYFPPRETSKWTNHYWLRNILFVILLECSRMFTANASTTPFILRVSFNLIEMCICLKRVVLTSSISLKLIIIHIKCPSIRAIWCVSIVTK